MAGNDILSVKELAIFYGLTVVEHCNCGGYPTDKFRDPKSKYLLSWRKNRYMFKFKKYNVTQKDWTPVKDLTLFMYAYFANERATEKN